MKKKGKIDIISFDHEKNKLDFHMFIGPTNIWKYYKGWNKFIFVSTRTSKGIPVINTAHELLHYQWKDHPWLEGQFDSAFRGYASGFLKGFETDFTPVINTNENKKELILKGIGINMGGGFPQSHNHATGEVSYNEKSFYDMGLVIGKNYKAWMFVLETPGYYKNDFPFTTEKEDVKENIETKVTPLAKLNKKTLAENKIIAEDFLEFLSGSNIHNEKIMKDADFKELLKSVVHLIAFETLPGNLKKIPQINISSATIRYTFYLIHKELYNTKKIKTVWIDFLHHVFKQFKNVDKKTTKTKFSVKPPLYDTDNQMLKK